MPAAHSPHDATSNNQRGRPFSPPAAGKGPPTRATQSSHSSSHNDSDSASSTSCHVPRPPNAFLIFRSEMIVKHNLKDVEPDQRNISRIVGLLWRDLPEEQKARYRQAAETRKLQYQLQRHEKLGQPAKSPKALQTQEDKVIKARKIADSIKHETEHSADAQDRDFRSFREPVASAPPDISQYFQSTTGHLPSSSVHASSTINHASASSSTYYPPSWNNAASISDSIPANFKPQYHSVTGDEDISEEELGRLMELFSNSG